MYLFVFAFLGNVFYVASILTSPKLGLPEPEASKFIRESIPYVPMCPTVFGIHLHLSGTCWVAAGR